MQDDPKDPPLAGPPHELSVSVVVFRPDLRALADTLCSLRIALGTAATASLVSGVTLWLIDNGSDDPTVVDRLVHEACEPRPAWLRVETIRGHGNVGYGRGHNLAILRTTGTYHLVLNPDVVLRPDAVSESIRYLDAHAQAGLLTPHVTDPDGQRQFLCKRYPSVLTLGLRGFGPRWLREQFLPMLDRYEMRDLSEHEPATGIPCASGCYMFARRASLQAIGGFSPDYFLYFEDFDLSLRFRHVGDIAYVPRVKIAHAGGSAARKGWLHRRLFVRSALTFFRRHGWRFW